MNHHHGEASMARELTPESRAVEGCTGVPIVLGDGNTWLLYPGGMMNALDDLRDTIDDRIRLSGRAPMDDVLTVASHLLEINFELSEPEVLSLLASADRRAVLDAVLEALFGPQDGRRTYSQWAASAFLANGMEPDKVPTAMHAHVLAQLVNTGRAIPAEKFIDSAVAAKKFAAFRSMARKAPPAEKPPAPEPTTNGAAEHPPEAIP